MTPPSSPEPPVRGTWTIRVLDVLAASLALAVLSPLMLVLAVLIRLDSAGGVFYRQERIGLRERPFRIYKFRTMVADADRRGPYFTQTGDARITRIGAWLRRHSLDELPQLINVVRGEMSLVGPRPDVAAQMELYSDEQRRLRHSVRPGITGIAQITNRHHGTLEQRIENDLRWVREYNLRRYRGVLLRTGGVLLHSRSF